MGLIKAALSATTGVIADQMKEYFYCDAIENSVLVLKGRKRNAGHGSDNIISNGSIINVADGQCMIIVESGKIVDICAEPGEYTYDTSTEPSVFFGDLKENIPAIFKEIGKRFTFDGVAPKDQRIYFFNTKEIMSNKYGTPNPVPFRVVDQRAGIDLDIGLRCFGEYSYRLVNPLLFYQNVCGNIKSEYTRDEIDAQLKSELLTALQPAFGKLSALGIRYSSIPAHTTELADALREELSASWGDRMGIEIQKIGVSSIKANEEDEQMIKEMQRTAAYADPKLAMAYTITAKGEAMKGAANNTNGPATGFFNLNMLNQATNDATLQTLQQMANTSPATQTTTNISSWICSCGATNTGKFCSECGTPKPTNETWTCTCGTVNKGKFCSNCGQPKPETKQCSDCGWKPSLGETAGKFCPNCGKPL
ncbi:MAG: SPFH domain-containing protein [Erysipelotrichaceae bacterium]|nr:SPFH domain-containing protein [Erysipelotrichaceae bacterium]